MKQAFQRNSHILDHLNSCMVLYISIKEHNVDWQGSYTLKISKHVSDADEGGILRQRLSNAPASVLRAATDGLLNEQRAARKGLHELQFQIPTGHVGTARKGRCADDSDPDTTWRWLSIADESW